MLQHSSSLTSKFTVRTGVVSRRKVLFRGITCVIGGGTVAGSLAIRQAQANAKVPKSQAGYKDSPKGGGRCDKCVQFQPPAACKIVDGAVSPSGSCNYFAPKPG